MNGFFLVDKAEGITSLNAIEEIRQITGIRKIGHAGTLDPMATGLLVVGIGKATRLLEFLEDQDKEYLLTIRFGILTDTLDTEGEIIAEAEDFTLDEARLNEALEKFKGELEQVVPEYSAVKIKGKPSYQLARQEKPFSPPTRKITIHSISLVSIEPPNATISVKCSKGTYMRSLARDIANSMETIGIAYQIRRTKVGELDVKDAIIVRETDDITKHIKSPEEILSNMPRVKLSEDQEYRFVNGQAVEIKPPDKYILVFGDKGLIGIGEAQGETHIKPHKVLSGE